MKHGKRILALVLGLLLLLLAVSGCSAKSMDAAENAAGGTVSSDMATAGEAPAPQAPTEESGSAGLLPGNAVGVLDTEKIIYTAYAEVETRDFDATIAEVGRMVQEYGAFVQSSSVTGSDYYSESRGYQVNRRAEYVLRVPKEKFSNLMDALPELGNVPYSHVDTENITPQYVDTEARLESYRVQQERLMALLEQAETVEDMLTIEGYLANVNYEIESLTSQLQNWDAQIDYSTVTLQISEVEVYTEEPATQQTYWQKLGTGLQRTLKGIGHFFQELLRLLVVYLPVLILVAVVLAVALLLLRRQRRKRRAAKEKTGPEAGSEDK